MISQSKTSVKAIKNKFESLNCENTVVIRKKSFKCQTRLYAQSEIPRTTSVDVKQDPSIESVVLREANTLNSFSDIRENLPAPNISYLYKNDIKRSLSDNKKNLIRQTSDPGKKLQRSHAFRCDRNQKINDSPKRAGSCNGRSESGDFALKMGDKKLSEARLKQLGSFLQKQMEKEHFTVNTATPRFELENIVPQQSIPDADVPKHILDQYAKVNKCKHKENEKQDVLTDSGVSSETENVDDEKNAKVSTVKAENCMNVKINVDNVEDENNSIVNRLRSQFESIESKLDDGESQSNLELMDDMSCSNETMKLEKKNPHLKLTDTLKKALKQPLPVGPPPQKPPRTFLSSEIAKRPKTSKEKLKVLQEVLNQREAKNSVRHIYDIAETNESTKTPKENHYLCTEILDITNRNLPSNQNNLVSGCFMPLKCAITANSTTSLPYTRLNDNVSNAKQCCVCQNELDSVTKRVSTFLNDKKCSKCEVNDRSDGDKFKCHLNCNCVVKNCEFYLDEPIYDEPFDDKSKPDGLQSSVTKSHYGTINKNSKSLEDLRNTKRIEDEEEKIYDVPYEASRPPSSEFTTSSPNNTCDKYQIDFEQLRQNFENGCRTQTAADATYSKSTENLAKNSELFSKSTGMKFGTDTRRYKKSEKGTERRRYTLPKKDTSQLDVDRENLNRLMNEIYDTVTAACNMDDVKPGGFPTDHSDGSTSEESVKLTRSLTEKRKNYVQRVSSRVAYLDPKNKTRFRHQTSICSYKSDVIDDQKQYSTFRSWKSFRQTLSNTKMADLHDSTDSKCNLTDSRGNILSMKDDFSASVDLDTDDISIDGKVGCLDIELPFEPVEHGLFNVCLLVGLNYMTGNAYVKSIFPKQVQLPPHLENLIFPETISSSRTETAAGVGAQCYSLVLTDEKGERSYGYCRRVLPEGATNCLPLCYCLIGKYRAPGFYYKILEEIESHHGSSDIEINSILQQLFETEFPNRGEEISITYEDPNLEIKYRYSLKPGDLQKIKSLPTSRKDVRAGGIFYDSFDDANLSGFGHSESADEDLDHRSGSLGQQFHSDTTNRGWYGSNEVLGHSESNDLKKLDIYDLENNNRPKNVILSLEGERIKTIKRPWEPRVDEDCLSFLLDSLGASVAIKVFGSLLLERKVVIISDQLSAVSSCIEALQIALYPFVWQQTLISIIPAEIRRDLLEAPLPILAGLLKTDADEGDYTGFEDGILIDLTNPLKVLCYQGDETTILPPSSYTSLKTSLQMMSIRNKDRQEDKMTRNVFISEAFLRFFVDILGDFWRFFSFGELDDKSLGKGDVVFDKEAFIKSPNSKHKQYFLEWFTETAMFNHFIQNTAVMHQSRNSEVGQAIMNLLGTPLPNFYEIFEERMTDKRKNVSHKNIDSKSNYKSALHKKVKLFKTKLKDLMT